MQNLVVRSQSLEKEFEQFFEQFLCFSKNCSNLFPPASTRGQPFATLRLFLSALFGSRRVTHVHHRFVPSRSQATT
jgi:hypothetical protein